MFLLGVFRRWWGVSRPRAERAVPYDVPCPCGRPLRGRRRPAPQIITCPACGRRQFIFPVSPWDASARPAAAPAARGMGRLVLGIVLGAVAAMALVFVLARPYLRRPPADRAGTPADARALLRAGQDHLRAGEVRLALRELNAASERAADDPDGLGRDERHRLGRLRRQCDLLARLLDVSLEEILRQAAQHRSDDEWRARFEDYRGRTVVFDDALRADAHGRPALAAYVVRAGAVEARVALEDLEEVRRLPLEPPRRWLFGARLAACRREEGGGWVLRFEPDSAVLLTDEDAAAVCCPAPLDDELRAVLRRQDELLR